MNGPKAFETSRLEEFDLFSSQFGRKCRFTQMDAGTFHGSFSRHHWQDVDTLSFSFSVAACIRQPCLPEFVVLGCLLSEVPIRINGQTLDQGGFFMLMPGSNVCITSAGPVTINTAIIADSRFETYLADAWHTIRRSITDTAIISPDMDDYFAGFKNWYLNWLSTHFCQDAQVQNRLSQQITAVSDSMLQRIGEDLKTDTNKYREAKMQESKHCILKLIDYFYQHPTTPCTTAEMSAIAGMKRRIFFYHFKNFTGYSPHYFFRYIRLQAARQTLLTRVDSITELAEKFHFHHHGEFSELYKKTYRELPSETRRKTLARLSGSA